MLNSTIHPPYRLSNCRQKGFSLLEALISIVLLSLGGLAIAGLQIASLRYAQTADARNNVALYASQMVELAVANARKTIAGDPGLVDSALKNVPCNSASGATTEIDRWRQSLDCQIPGATGAVDYNRARNLLTVSIQWNDDRAPGGGILAPMQTFHLNTRL